MSAASKISSTEWVWTDRDEVYANSMRCCNHVWNQNEFDNFLVNVSHLYTQNTDMIV